MNEHRLDRCMSIHRRIRDREVSDSWSSLRFKSHSWWMNNISARGFDYCMHSILWGPEQLIRILGHSYSWSTPEVER